MDSIEEIIDYCYLIVKRNVLMTPKKRNEIHTLLRKQQQENTKLKERVKELEEGIEEIKTTTYRLTLLTTNNTE